MMKQNLITGLIFFLPAIGFGQDSFILKSIVGDVEVSINGSLYSVDSGITVVPTYYPRFDTLVFKSEMPRSNVPIICNFKPDTIYSISLACCGGLDIIPTSKFKNDSLKYWDYEKDFDKIQNQLMDKPYLSIRTMGVPEDSIFAWHADAACMTEYKVINDKLWRLGVPPKCFYWNNITSILFFKQDDNMAKHEESDLEGFLGISNIVELAEINLRLFDNERFVLIFDAESKNIELKYE